MAVTTKIIVQQILNIDDTKATASKFPRYTVTLGNSISSITASELVSSIEAAAKSAAAAKDSEIAAKTSELNAKNSEQEAAISAGASEASAAQSATSATQSAASADRSAESAAAAKVSETNAKTSEDKAKASETNAKTSETNAKTSETNAKASEDKAKSSETNAAASAIAAKASEDKAKSSETNAAASASDSKGYRDEAEIFSAQAGASASAAKTSETNAKTSETNAKTSETNAKTSETNAAHSAASASQSVTTIQGLKSDVEQLKTDTQLIKDSTISETTALKSDVEQLKIDTQSIKDSAVTETTVLKDAAAASAAQASNSAIEAGQQAGNAAGSAQSAFTDAGRAEVAAGKAEGIISKSLLKENNLSDLSNINASRQTLLIDSLVQDGVHTFLYSHNRLYRFVIRDDGLIVLQRDTKGDGISWETLPLSTAAGGTGADTPEGARYNLGVDRLFQNSGETVLYSPNKNKYLTIPDEGDHWGVYDATTNQWIPLGIQFGGTGAKDANGIRNNIGLGEKHAPKFLSLNVENETENATTANAGIYHSKLKNTQGEDIGSSQSYFETQVGVGKHTIGVFHNGASQYYQFNENGTFSGAKSISLAPGAGIYADGNERNASQLFSIMNPPINTWTGVSRYNWYDDYAIAGLIRRGDTHVESFGIELYQAGIQSYMHKFYPDGRTHSAQYTGKTKQMGWDDPNYWGNALVWGEIIPNNDGGWAPGLSWGTQSTGGYPLRATWGLIAQGNNNWPFCSLRLRGDGEFFCNFQFQPASNDITTWSSTGNYVFQKAASSDRDLKHDIIYTDGKESYDRVMQWLPTMFKYNGSDIQRFGLIAQDLLKIDPEYVKLIPGGDIFADVIGVNDEGEEYVDRQIVVDKADDTLALDNNVIMADLACAFRYQADKVNKLEQELTELKKLVSELIKPDNS
ncbi:putative tail tip protein [Escherichia phage vB_EcoD-Elw]|nr:putative tail tip protein [Escherichia phage vB_EcoD-Elw]